MKGDVKIMRIKSVLKKIKKAILPSKVVKVTVAISAPNKKLENEVVLITGGATGIGKATAKIAVDQNANVIIVGRREEKLKKACQEIGEDNCRYLVCDVTDINDYNLFLNQAEEIFSKKITSVVCNAGIYIQKSPFEFANEDFDKIMGTNLKAPFFLIQQFSKYCITKGIDGTVVVTASNRALYGDYGPYGVSKAGIVNYVKGMAREYQRFGIRINAVAPGMTASEINNIDSQDNLYSESPKGNRVLLPEEIAEVIVFLLSRNSKCITGAIIPCDEGDSLR